jgi:hypothetical protein
VPHFVCSKCGFQSASEAKFCRQCGQATVVGEPRAPEPVTAMAPRYLDDSVTDKAGRFKAKAIAQMLVVLAGLFLFTEAMTALISGASSMLPDRTTEDKAAFTAQKPGKKGRGVTGTSFAESLTHAKQYLVAAGSEPNQDWAKYTLGQVPETAPEYKEAQMLLSEISTGSIKPASDFEIEHADAVEALAGIDKSLTFPKLKSDPDQYLDETCGFNGKIIEIHDQDEYAEAKIRVGPNASDVIYINGYFPLKLVVNDFVYVIGTVSGHNTYEAKAGTQLTVPYVRVIAMFEQKDLAKLKAALARLDENERIVAMIEEKATGRKKTSD